MRIEYDRPCRMFSGNPFEAVLVPPIDIRREDGTKGLVWVNDGEWKVDEYNHDIPMTMIVSHVASPAETEELLSMMGELDRGWHYYLTDGDGDTFNIDGWLDPHQNYFGMPSLRCDDEFAFYLTKVTDLDDGDHRAITFNNVVPDAIQDYIWKGGDWMNTRPVISADCCAYSHAAYLAAPVTLYRLEGSDEGLTFLASGAWHIVEEFKESDELIASVDIDNLDISMDLDRIFADINMRGILYGVVDGKGNQYVINYVAQHYSCAEHVWTYRFDMTPAENPLRDLDDDGDGEGCHLEFTPKIGKIIDKANDILKGEMFVATKTAGYPWKWGRTGEEELERIKRYNNGADLIDDLMFDLHKHNFEDFCAADKALSSMTHAQRDAINYLLGDVAPGKTNLPTALHIYSNPPYTTVEWNDHTKTTVKYDGEGEYDIYAGVCCAFTKKVLGSATKVNKMIEDAMPKPKKSAKQIEKEKRKMLREARKQEEERRHKMAVDMEVERRLVRDEATERYFRIQEARAKKEEANATD